MNPTVAEELQIQFLRGCFVFNGNVMVMHSRINLLVYLKLPLLKKIKGCL